MNCSEGALVNSTTTLEIPTEFSTVRVFIMGYALTITGILGIVGNILSFLVLSRRRFKSPFTIILKYLNVYDFITILSIILEYGIPSILEYNKSYSFITVLLPKIRSLLLGVKWIGNFFFFKYLTL